ncbi:MAG TPA: F0F1 ATP synthase subunit epsilon [Trebonia sp.]|nr:F0F1 ATP synthase subunit epsilon [Trebonia sp.]
MTLHVELLMPDRSLWSGEADMVIAKTTDGDIGVLAGHAPVFGILSPGSLVRIQPAQGGGEETPAEMTSGEVRAAVRDGFLSVTDDRVSILASVGELAADVDVSAVQSDLDTATTEAGSAAAAEESVEVRYARARLRAADQQA